MHVRVSELYTLYVYFISLSFSDQKHNRQLGLQLFRQKANFIDWLFNTIAEKLTRRRAAHHSALLSNDYREGGSFDALISMAMYVRTIIYIFTF